MLSISAKFKIFLGKNLRETCVFVDEIWKKFRNINQYKIEIIVDWLTYVERFEFVLKRFHGITALTDNFLIW